ncbi:unnamed protein product [Pleuronectes platessa]|uniref:Uncharacterized protein n=1 Tax=Pleuronectes platessa TaxID=8262 RepID=A0A9N7US24_PLEPL|nr:unnamed protein product [Pleuronectes platessa]
MEREVKSEVTSEGRGPSLPDSVKEFGALTVHLGYCGNVGAMCVCVLREPLPALAELAQCPPNNDRWYLLQVASHHVIVHNKSSYPTFPLFTSYVHHPIIWAIRITCRMLCVARQYTNMDQLEARECQQACSCGPVSHSRRPVHHWHKAPA